MNLSTVQLYALPAIPENLMGLESMIVDLRGKNSDYAQHLLRQIRQNRTLPMHILKNERPILYIFDINRYIYIYIRNRRPMCYYNVIPRFVNQKEARDLLMGRFPIYLNYKDRHRRQTPAKQVCSYIMLYIYAVGMQVD